MYFWMGHDVKGESHERFTAHLLAYVEVRTGGLDISPIFTEVASEKTLAPQSLCAVTSNV